MVVVDASVWVSRLAPQDVHHVASRRWLARVVSEGGIAAPMLLLAEVSGAIARRTGQPELGHAAVAQILRVPSLRLVSLDEKLALQTAKIAADWRLRGADALYAAVAFQLNLPLVSWDKEQVDRVSEFIEASMPE